VTYLEIDLNSTAIFGKSVCGGHGKGEGGSKPLSQCDKTFNGVIYNRGR
jgi:hypothetical protein